MSEALEDRAKKFLDIQSYGALIPETRRIWTAWLVGFAEQETKRELARCKAKKTICPRCGSWIAEGYVELIEEDGRQLSGCRVCEGEWEA